MLKKPKKIAGLAGVYIFRKGSEPLYIGKAANLKKRLASYFQKGSAQPIKIRQMLEEATRLQIIKTDSEVEALIKEAELIKRYRPKYNALMRDDKTYFFVGVTREAFPKIFVTHQPVPKVRARYLGPFTSGTAVQGTLKLLRRVFPYCTCKRPHKRPCLNAELGRCLGYCCSPRHLGFL